MLFIKFVLRVPLRMSDEMLLVGDDAVHGVSVLFTSKWHPVDLSLHAHRKKLTSCTMTQLVMWLGPTLALWPKALTWDRPSHRMVTRSDDHVNV